MSYETSTQLERTNIELDIRTAKEIRIWQAFARIIFTLPWLLFVNKTAIQLKRKDFRPGIRYVIASNHQSHWDAFMLFIALYRSETHRMLPFRAITSNHFFKNPVTCFLALNVGCFPAKANAELPYGIPFSIFALNQNHTVYICPEGGLGGRGERDIRPGVAVLAHEPNVMVVPAHIEWRRGWPWRTFKLGIGKPFDASAMSAEEIMDRVYAQPVD